MRRSRRDTVGWAAANEAVNQELGLGAAVGGLVNPVYGPALGGLAEGMMKTIIGQGDYATIDEESGHPVKANTLVQKGEMAEQIANMHEKGITRISHREYIMDVPMTVAFNRTSMDIDPTNVAMFPWLAPIARAYQQYKILGMVFEFRSTSANAVTGTNAGMGTVTLSAVYDVNSPPPVSKLQANNAEFAVSCKPSESEAMIVECEPELTVSQPLLVAQPTTTISAPQLYKFGRLDVITQGAAASYTSCGELWVTYDIGFMKPIVPVNGVQYEYFLQLNCALPTALLGPIADTPTQSQPVFDNIGMSLGANYMSLIFPHSLLPGTSFFILLEMLGSSTSNVSAPTVSFDAGLGPNYQLGWFSQVSSRSPGSAATSDRLTAIYSVVYDGTGTPTNPPIMIFDAVAAVPASARGSLRVLQINSGIAPHTSALTTPTTARLAGPNRRYPEEQKTPPDARACALCQQVIPSQLTTCELELIFCPVHHADHCRQCA